MADCVAEKAPGRHRPALLDRLWKRAEPGLHPARKKVSIRGAKVLAVLVCLEALLALIPPITLALRQAALRASPHPSAVLAVLGDSVPYGYGVPSAASFPGQLDRWLGERSGDRSSVKNFAFPSADTRSVLHGQLEWLRAVPSVTSRTVLIQVGHNNFLTRGSALRGEPREADERKGFAQARTISIPVPRVLRLLSTLGGVIRGERPQARAADVTEARFVQELRAIGQAVKGLGWRPFYLTYLIPGRPVGIMSAYSRDVVLTTRRVQTRVNALIRQVALEEHDALIDLEAQVPTSAFWNQSYFLDNIHLTAKANREVARVIWHALAGFGALPGSDSQGGIASRQPPERYQPGHSAPQIGFPAPTGAPGALQGLPGMEPPDRLGAGRPRKFPPGGPPPAPPPIARPPLPAGQGISPPPSPWITSGYGVIPPTLPLHGSLQNHRRLEAAEEPSP